MSTATLKAPQTQASTTQIKLKASHDTSVEAGTLASDLPRKWPITADAYLRMAEIGLFEGKRVELIGGDIITMPPISEDHAQSLTDTSEKLYEPFLGKFKIRAQQPFNAGEHGRPEPDIAVVRAASLAPSEPPLQALLLVEISETTLHYDRTSKASLYASLGIADYWIVNLIDNQVEVYRQPIESQSAQFGHEYASRQIYRAGQSVTLLEAPEVAIPVDAMLP